MWLRRLTSGPAGGAATRRRAEARDAGKQSIMCRLNTIRHTTGEGGLNSQEAALRAQPREQPARSRSAARRAGGDVRAHRWCSAVAAASRRPSGHAGGCGPPPRPAWMRRAGVNGAAAGECLSFIGARPVQGARVGGAARRRAPRLCASIVTARPRRLSPDHQFDGAAGRHGGGPPAPGLRRCRAPDGLPAERALPPLAQPPRARTRTLLEHGHDQRRRTDSGETR